MEDFKKIKTDFREKAVLVGLITKSQSEEMLDEYLDELAFLTETAGAIPLKRFTQKLERPDTRTFVGKGKLQEIVEYIKAGKFIHFKLKQENSFT